MLRGMTPNCILALALLCFAPLSHAQFSSGNSSSAAGEVIELSPFSVTVEEDRGYRANSIVAGKLPPAAPPVAAVTLIRRADAVVIQFALSNSADKQETRNKQLSGSIEQIAAAIKAGPGLKLEHREVRFTSGDRRGSFIGKGEVVTSYANIAILAEVTADLRLYERVNQVRELVDQTKLTGDTKILTGPVGLFVRRPNEARRELLAKVFEDLEIVKKGLGPDFEVLPSGLSTAVQMRACSESDVELWLDYSFSIRSVREITARTPASLLKQ
jgi:hypothetical protein